MPIARQGSFKNQRPDGTDFGHAESRVRWAETATMPSDFVHYINDFGAALIKDPKVRRRTYCGPFGNYRQVPLFWVVTRENEDATSVLSVQWQTIFIIVRS